MTKEKQGGPDALTLAKSALEKIDKDKFPKRYQLQEKLIKALELAQNQKIRAEKAEKGLKKPKEPQGEGTPTKSKEEGTPKIPDLSLQDIRALNDVHDEDIELVQDWAKFKSISLAEAKKVPHIQELLRTRQEERKTAQAANTGGGRKGTSKISGDEFLQDFQKTGKLPDSYEDMKKLAEARYKSPK